MNRTQESAQDARQDTAQDTTLDAARFWTLDSMLNAELSSYPGVCLPSLASSLSAMGILSRLDVIWERIQTSPLLAKRDPGT